MHQDFNAKVINHSTIYICMYIMSIYIYIYMHKHIYIYVCVCEKALRVICTSTPAPLKCVCSFGKLLHVNAKIGVPDYPSLGI